MLIQEKLLAGLSRVSISLQKYFMAYLRNSISRLMNFYEILLKVDFFAFKDSEKNIKKKLTRRWMSLLTYKAITFEIDIIIKCDDKRYFIISSLVIKYKILTKSA